MSDHYLPGPPLVRPRKTSIYVQKDIANAMSKISRVRMGGISCTRLVESVLVNFLILNMTQEDSVDNEAIVDMTHQRDEWVNKATDKRADEALDK